MSPERISGDDYSYSSDVWSFGMMLLATALGRLPFETNKGYWGVLHCIRWVGNEAAVLCLFYHQRTNRCHSNQPFHLTLFLGRPS